MTQPTLTQEQREQLLALMERRLDKLDDKTLLELERLSRNPRQLTDSAATSETALAPLPPPPAPERAPLVVHEPPERAISRRRLLAGLGAVAAAGVVGGGGYAVGVSQTRQSAERDVQAGAAAQAAIDDLDPQVAALAEQASETARAARAQRDVAVACSDRYPAIRSALDRWWADTALVNDDYETMRLVEGGVKVVADLLSALASLPSFALEALDLIQVELGNLDDVRDALRAVSDLLTHLDPALRSADWLHTELTPWFSEQSEADLKRRLLRPLQEELYPRIADLDDQCQQFAADWLRDLVTPIRAAQGQTGSP